MSSVNVTLVLTTTAVALQLSGPAGPAGAAGVPGAAGAPGVVQSVVAGANVTVDNSDPAHPVVASTGGGGGGGGSSIWGGITGTLANQTDLQTALDAKVVKNGSITPATKTKVTYDAKGLVTSGADATTADVADGTDKRYVTDAQRTVLGNTSGTNTGDQDLSGLALKITTVNGHPLSANVTVTASDVGLDSVDNTADAAKAVLSATKLATARNIDGQAFDGTAAITVIAPGTHAATSKATPIDADELPLVDSAASNVLKKLTWANLKATIKTYYDAVASVMTNKDLTSGTNTFPTFNQNTTGSAAKWTTARNLAGNSVDGSANVTFANKFIVQGTTDTGLSAAQFLGALGTGVVKNTTTTGVLSIAVAGDFPTLNQDTTGSAAKLTTARNIAGVAFDGSAAISLTSGGGIQKGDGSGGFTAAVAGTDYLAPAGNGSALTGITESQVANLPTDLAAKAPALVPTAVKTANYSAVAQDFVPVDTTSGNVTITLPTTPADGTRIGVKMVTQGSTNTVAIAAGGSDVFNKTGGSTSVTLTYALQGTQFQYKASTGIWYVVDADLGLTALDSRYAQKSNNLSDLASAATARTNLGLGNVDNTSDATKNAAVAIITNKDLTSSTNTFPTIAVNHGSTASTARPVGATWVHWIGSVAPTNAVTNDEWTNTTTKMLQYYNGSVWYLLNGIPPSDYISGDYYMASYISTSTITFLLTNGVLRLQPFIVTTQVSISRIGAEVTTVGSAGAVVRIGIYGNKTGDFYPDALVVDAGTISGTSATVQEITLGSPTVLQPGLYWFGLVGQGAPTTSATVRATGTGLLSIPTTTIPAANSQTAGFQQSSVTGALPANFTNTPTPVLSMPRTFFRVT